MLALPSAAIELKEQAREARMLERWLAVDRAGLAGSAGDGRNTRRLMFSDTPDFVAWTTGRPTVWLTRDEFGRLFSGRGGSLPPAIPRHPGPADTWFHREDPRHSGDQAGEHLPAVRPTP
jgi:hypothetical protein